MKQTIQAYLDSLPPLQAHSLNQIRQVLTASLPAGFVEQCSFGMIGYVVPLTVYPAGYLQDPDIPLPLMNLGAQKNHLALYHYGLYADPALHDWFIKAYTSLAYKHKPDMGKSCIRFKYSTEIPLDLLGDLAGKISLGRWIELYEHSRQGRQSGPSA